MKKQHVIALVVAIVVIILICLVMIFSGNKSEKGDNSVQNETIINDIDWENIEVTTINFKMKNSTGKDISKIYIRNNTNENYSDDLTDEIKNETEKEVSYGNYSPYYSWDMKIVFSDGTEKTLNSMLAANQLYNGAILELVDLGDNIDAVNHEMGNPIEENTEAEEKTDKSAEQSNPENAEAEAKQVAEETDTNKSTTTEEIPEEDVDESEDETNDEAEEVEDEDLEETEEAEEE